MRVDLVPPLGPALTKAAADLRAAPAEAETEWRLPDGVHDLDGPLALDVAGRTVRLRGSDACTLRFATGGLSVAASAVEIVELTIDTADGPSALVIRAGRISLTDVDAGATGDGTVAAIDLDAREGTVDANDVVISRAQGQEAVGLRAMGGTVRVVGALVRHVHGDSAQGVRIGALAAADAVGIAIEDVQATTGPAVGLLAAAGGALEVAGIRASDLLGRDVLGVAVLGFGHQTAELSATDLEAKRLVATARATGLLVAAPRRLKVRGFTAEDVSGPAAAGAIVVGGVVGGAADGTDIEVGFGRIGSIVGSAGDAAGLRVVALPSPRPLVVRDVAVDGVVGTPVPAGATPPRDDAGHSAWQAWAVQALEDLGNDATARPEPIAMLDVAGVVGLAVTAIDDAIHPFLDGSVAGDLAVIDCSVRTVSGPAVQIETGMRPLWLRRTALHTALRAGFVQADQLVIANTTWDRLGAPLLAGPGELRVTDSIFSRFAGAGAPVALDADAEWTLRQAAFSDVPSEGFEDLGALPYVAPGAAALPAPLLQGQLPPPETVDLRIVAGSELHRSAVPPPDDDLELSDDRRLFVGAFPPDVPARCDLYDPLRPSHGAAQQPPAASPVVDYRARDAGALLAVMLGRARQVMRPWTDRGAADFTTMTLEAVAERLDHIAYQQERAVAEGFLEDARLRRSVEDHVRPLDYEVDPGLSATVMLRFHLDLAKVAAAADERDRRAKSETSAGEADRLEGTLAALRELADDGALEIPTHTLAANRRDEDQVIVFATEEPLAYFPSLDAIALTEDAPAGATDVELQGLRPELPVGRWLVLWRGPGLGGHVIRVTTVARHGTDVVRVGWDPRRPLPWPLLAKGDPGAGLPPPLVFGNVTPAHHGVPLPSEIDTDSSRHPDAPHPRDAHSLGLERFDAPLQLKVRGGPGVEVPLPFAPISIQASGYPLPGQEKRRGRPVLRVEVGEDRDQWALVDDLATAGPGDEVFALRTTADGRAAARFGDGSSGAALPGVETPLRFTVAIGCGSAGNVSEGILSRLLFVPVDQSRGPFTGWLFRESLDVVRGLLTVSNPIAAVGGRDPEPIHRMSYRAPLLVARPLSAVTAEDYERVARSLPDVAGAHARVVAAAVRPVVRVSVLLRDEDTLDPDERLRRWAAVRAALERARLLGYDVETVPPVWAPLDLDVAVDAHPHADAGAVHDDVVAAVSGDGGLLDPDTAGLGGDVQLADVYRAVLSAPGVAAARVRRFRRLLPQAPERLPAGFIPIAADEVAVVRGPARPAADGVLTVTVCGGLR